MPRDIAQIHRDKEYISGGLRLGRHEAWGRGGRRGGGIAKGYGFLSEVMAAQLQYIKNYCIVQLTWVNCKVCELYLNKVVTTINNN